MTLPEPVHGKPLNILLVEDDDGDAKAMQRAFLKARIANPIVRVVDGVDALDILKGTNGKPKMPSPNILIVDLNMPRMNGVQLVQAIRADEEIRHAIRFHSHDLEARGGQDCSLRSQCRGIYRQSDGRAGFSPARRPDELLLAHCGVAVAETKHPA